MNPESSKPPTSLLKSRLQLVALATVFFGPFLYAAWLFYAGGWQPAEHTNKGELVDPPLQLPNLALATPDGPRPEALRGLWSLFYLERADCDDVCRDTLIQVRQIRLAAGRDVDRIGRIYLGATLPDAAWLDAGHKGLIATTADENPEFAAATAALGGGIYLIDPVGQVMMRFEPGMDSKAIYNDLHKLLKLTR